MEKSEMDKIIAQEFEMPTKQPAEQIKEFPKLQISNQGTEWKGQSRSDLQEMTISLNSNTRNVKRLVFCIVMFGTFAFLTIWGSIAYIIKTGAVNNYIAHCV